MFNGPQNPGPIRGSNPLIYTGSTPNMVIMNRRPNPTDIAQFELGHWWIIPVDTTFTTGEVWTLVSKAEGIATWKKLHGGGGPTPPTNTYVINKIYLTTPGAGTYTPTTGMKQCYVECIGGGASGGTTNTTWTPQWITAPPGGAGAYCAKLYTDVQIGASQSYVIGAGGIAPTANANANGNNGANTTFMGMTAGGGFAPTYVASGQFDYGSPLGGTATGGDINISGGFAMIMQINIGVLNYQTQSVLIPGSSFYSQGFSQVIQGTPGGTVNGTNGVMGSGGGAATIATNGLAIGGNGGDGMIIITEYLA